jgi:hypothetical protein
MINALLEKISRLVNFAMLITLVWELNLRRSRLTEWST